MTADPDIDLSETLRQGVPTGILSPAPASGIWHAIDEPEAIPEDLLVRREPWTSAAKEQEKALALLEKDVSDGFAFELLGGEAEAVQRFGKNFAAGKLAVVIAEGKPDRLVGDGSISNANGKSRICEKISLPGLFEVQEFVSRQSYSSAWAAFSLDVKGAHKRILVHPTEHGFSCFCVGGRWFCYRSCYFGCSWAAYWWARAAAFYVRLQHRLLWTAHFLALYVDDLNALFPAATAPLQALLCIMFASALGIPLSWHKLQLGSTLQWVGWMFHMDKKVVCLPASKQETLLCLLKPFFATKSRVEKKQLQRLIGMLIWFTAGAIWLRPWLASFFEMLYKPKAVAVKLDLHQLDEVRWLMSSNLRLSDDASLFDGKKGWKLHSVNNSVVSSPSDVDLVRPLYSNGLVFVVFFDFDCDTARVSADAQHASRVLYNAIWEQQPIPLCITEKGGCTAAADAWADEDTAGIGGWWLPPGLTCHPANIHWFSWQLTRQSLPKWFKTKDSPSMQSTICALEALAQLVLLLLRVQQGSFHSSRCSIALRQQCDNAGVVFSTKKSLSQKQPLCWILQALGFWSCKLGLVLKVSHIAGVRNDWADWLSRGRAKNPEFWDSLSADNQHSLDLLEILQRPWEPINCP